MSSGAALQGLDDVGYLVVPRLLPEAVCTDVRAEFAASVRDFDGLLLRQGSGRQEAHKRGPGGLILNPLLAPHELEASRFAGFVRACLALVGYPSLLSLIGEMVGEPPALVETMYFESASGNGVHADAHYMDAAPPGRMIGVWVALETISSEAGRFFLYPRSHLLGTDALPCSDEYATYAAEVRDNSLVGADMVGNAAKRAISRRRIARILRGAGLEAVAPALLTGDAVFWDSRTLHGSYAPRSDQRTRHSITAHYLGLNGSYLVAGRIEPLRLRRFEDLYVHHRGRA